MSNSRQDALPRLFKMAAKASSPLGIPRLEERDLTAMIVDQRLWSSSTFEEHFRREVEKLSKEVDRDLDRLGKAVQEYAETYQLIERQLEWTLGKRAVEKFLRYLRLGHVVFPPLMKLLRRKDRAMDSAESKEWLRKRREFGAKSVDFLEETERLAETHRELQAKLRCWRAAMQIDYVGLPKLTSASSDRPTIDSARRDIDNALSLLKGNRGGKDDFDVYFWRSKGLRHLAMADIKIGEPGRAFVELAVSGLFARQVRSKSTFLGLATELARGYAEVHRIIGDNGLVAAFLADTPYSPETIANYVADQVEVPDVRKLPAKFVLVRHAERESDAKKQFGFSGNQTERGRNESSYIVKRIAQILRDDDSIGQVCIVTDDWLSSEALDLKKRLSEAVPNLGQADFLVTTSEQWRPIDVGDFRDMQEVEAQNRFPGVYRELTEYRLGERDGFCLAFPGGESVKEFDERITEQFADILLRMSEPSLSDQEIPKRGRSTITVLFGHTSTLTAVLNMFRDFKSRKMLSPFYGFEPIETGSIIEVKMDLAMKDLDWEMHRLPGAGEGSL
jgi:broad specificity phosphatase PhoE